MLHKIIGHARVLWERLAFRCYYRRKFEDMPAEAYLLSYPKCGRSWLRVMIAKALAVHFKLRFVSISRLFNLTFLTRTLPVPVTVINHDDNPMRKTVAELETDKSRYRDNKVLFLVRDPRDVIVSMHYQATYRERNNQLPIEEFVFAERGGIDSLIAFFNIWDNNRDVPRDFLLVTYEGLHADPKGELRRVLAFMGVRDVSDDTLEEAVAFGSFENLQKIDRGEGEYYDPRLVARRTDDAKYFKARKGKVGGYKESLSAEAIARLDRRINETLSDAYREYKSQ